VLSFAPKHHRVRIRRGWTTRPADIHWSPDGKSLQYFLGRNGARNIWDQPLSGGPAKEITDFPSGLIFDFAWSNDGKELYVAKGERTSDVILISNFR
jgi:Tol biopolymer transport system component